MLASAKAELVVPLLSNVSWHIEPEAAKTLYRRLGHEADVAELLLAREELPAVVRALHVHLLRQRFAADLASRPFMAENRARLMLVESEEVALTAIAAEARAEEMNELAQFFVRHGLLTSALLVRLAARGSTAFLRHALAVIGCGKPEANITRLVGAAQLPEVVALVLRHALEVPADMQGDSFGVRVIERLALASDGVEARTRAMALQLLAEAGGEATQAVANALAGELGLVAA